MRFYLQHWGQGYWRDEAQARGDEGAPFYHTASDQFGPRGLQPGDRLYVVGLRDEQLLLIGRMDVEHVVQTREAKRILGKSHLFPRRWHAIARPPISPLSFERHVSEPIARAIRTADEKPLKIDRSIYRIPNQALTTGRFLNRESAAALDSLIDGERVESEEVRDVETQARGRMGLHLSTEQRDAVEKHAVVAAEEHFASEGWVVDDVGQLRPYDLHCTKGKATLHVEVKGTTGPLSTIPLTAGEVKLANDRHPNTALFVMYAIKLDGTPARPKTRGGEVYLEQPWRPKRSRLRAIAYSYRLDAYGT
jgi:hypothetical protein